MAEQAVCRVSMKRRTIYLSGEIDQDMAVSFRKAVARLTYENLEKVTIEINSEGGDMDATFLIVDTMMTASLDFVTLVTGRAMSAAALILAAGQSRYALPNALVMVHQGSFSLEGNFTQVQNELGLIKRAESTYSRLLEQFTKKPEGFWDEKWKQGDVYLTAVQALELNVVDHVIVARTA